MALQSEAASLKAQLTESSAAFRALAQDKDKLSFDMRNEIAAAK